MSYINDNQNQGWKTYRDHTPDVTDLDRRSTRQGIIIVTQDDTTGKYNVQLPGDEGGWLHWGANTRVFGSWSQAVPAIKTEENGLRPILDKTLALDSSFAYKTASSIVGDVTKYREAEETEDGTPGILLQCLNQDSHEQIFFPLGASQIRVDWKSAGNESTKIYDVKADGTIDLANFGLTKDLWYVDTSRAYIHTDARFRYDATKKGRLDFSSSSIPAASAGETLYNVGCYWDYGSGLWKWYVVVTDGTGIVADNTNAVDSSTYIYGAVAGGGADPANKGSMKEVFYIESNFPYIKTGASFRYDATKKGPIDFRSGAVPSPTAGETQYQVPLYFSGGAWSGFVNIADESAGTFCRVAWNFDEEQDLSEGETVTYDSGKDTWTGTGTKIWIDWQKSRSVKFETAGTNTIFEAVLIASNYTRRNQARDLYRLTNCADDNGYIITHMQKSSVSAGRVTGYLLSDEISSFPWEEAIGSRIKTRIGVSDLPNKMQSRIAAEWDTREQDWNFVEVNDISKSLPWYFAPIKPIVSDPDNSIYESYYQTNNFSQPIAKYKRVL